MLSLIGLDGSVAIEGRTVTVKRDSGKKGQKPIVLSADSVLGAAVWTGALEGQFSVHYRYRPASSAGGDPASVEYVSVRFAPADKDWWDAMASTVMGVVRRSGPATGARAADKAVADAIPAGTPSFDGWLNRTIGLEAEKPTGHSR